MVERALPRGSIMKLRLIAAVSAGFALLALSLAPASACYYGSDDGYSYSYQPHYHCYNCY
jgi:hypothetical protein